MISERLAARWQELVARAILEDPDFVHIDSLPDFLERITTTAYHLSWDSGGMAGGGGERVERLGRWYLTSSSDFGWDGPFETLDDAVGSIFTTEATREVWSDEWDDLQIIARMHLAGQPERLVINGNTWPYEHLELAHQRLHGG